MPITLHAAFVPSAQQMIGATRDLVERAEAWCTQQGCAPETLIDARLHEGMLPFAYQVKSVAEHTRGAIDGIRNGRFSPNLDVPPRDFDGLRAKLDQAAEELGEVTVNELEGLIGAPMRFEFGEMGLPFTADEFLLSFSQPNYYFHATTAYAIMRMKGVPLGKRDFMGKLRIARG